MVGSFKPFLWCLIAIVSRDAEIYDGKLSPDNVHGWIFFLGILHSTKKQQKRKKYWRKCIALPHIGCGHGRFLGNVFEKWELLGCESTLFITALLFLRQVTFFKLKLQVTGICLVPQEETCSRKKNIIASNCRWVSSKSFGFFCGLIRCQVYTAADVHFKNISALDCWHRWQYACAA